MNSLNGNIAAWPRCLATLRVRTHPSCPLSPFCIASPSNGETHNPCFYENVRESVVIFEFYLSVVSSIAIHYIKVYFVENCVSLE